MSDKRVNLHATAIVVGETGIVFVGPSGCGKSELAFSFLVEAERCGLQGALVADDQIFVRLHENRIIAERPDSISELIELRGSGIIKVKSVAFAAMHYAVTPALSPESPRLPPEDEIFSLPCGGELPLLRIPLHSITPYGKFAALAQNLFTTKGK